MSRLMTDRIRAVALALLFVPGFCLMLIGCGPSPQGETGTSVQTTQEELDQIEAEMQSNEAANQ